MNRDDEHQRVAETYRHYAASARRRRSWSDQNPGNLAIRRELTEAVEALAASELSGAGRILDIGSGSGWWLERLAGRPEITAGLHGVDILPDRVRGAQERVPAAAVEVADARALRFETASFDVVTMFTLLSSLASVEDATGVLHEAARVLRPGGAIVIWEPRLPNPLNRSTLLIRGRLLRAALAAFEADARTLTLLPPLARRLGGQTDRLYPVLARLPALRTHRLTVLRRGG